MMTTNGLLRVLLTLAFCVSATACGGADDTATTTDETSMVGDMAGGEVEAPTMDIVDTAASVGTFNTLIAAVRAAELEDALRGEGPFTVFAPTDEAFAALEPGTVESLLQPESRAALVNILTYHVVAGAAVDSTAAVGAGTATTMQGGALEIAQQEDGSVTVGGATVIQADVAASNGIIHVIDTVLLPPAGE
jgi:uncharacterized surface protein with fasciclin (FAS1) repeats